MEIDYQKLNQIDLAIKYLYLRDREINSKTDHYLEKLCDYYQLREQSLEVLPSNLKRESMYLSSELLKDIEALVEERKTKGSQKKNA